MRHEGGGGSNEGKGEGCGCCEGEEWRRNIIKVDATCEIN